VGALATHLRRAAIDHLPSLPFSPSSTDGLFAANFLDLLAAVMHEFRERTVGI
jgi:hypothetical protein